MRTINDYFYLNLLTNLKEGLVLEEMNFTFEEYEKLLAVDLNFIEQNDVNYHKELVYIYLWVKTNKFSKFKELNIQDKFLFEAALIQKNRHVCFGIAYNIFQSFVNTMNYNELDKAINLMRVASSCGIKASNLMLTQLFIYVIEDFDSAFQYLSHLDQCNKLVAIYKFITNLDKLHIDEIVLNVPKLLKRVGYEYKTEVIFLVSKYLFSNYEVNMKLLRSINSLVKLIDPENITFISYIFFRFTTNVLSFNFFSKSISLVPMIKNEINS